jgi:arabinofuranan 3-O-arabinosyltransferase
VTLPPIADGRRQNATVAVPVSFPALSGRYFTFTVTGVRLENTKNPTPIALPIGIAELGIPGVTVSPPPAVIPAPCRSNLLSVDGRSVPIKVTGPSRAALAGQGLTIEPCGSDANGLTLAAGHHVVKGADGAATGLNIDQLLLASTPPAPPSGGATGSSTPSAVPVVHVTSSTTTSFRLRITGATAPFWLVLGESLNAGWKATVAGSGASLGTPSLIDGFANGWLVDPSKFVGTSGTKTMSVTLDWAPQHTVDEALVISAAATALCLVLALWPRRRRVAHGRRGRRVAASAGASDGDAPAVTVPVGPTPQDKDLVPVLVSPLAAVPVLSMAEALIVALITGIVGAAIVPKAPIGLFIGLLVLVALIVPRGRGALAVLVPGLCAGAVLYVLFEQATKHFIAAGWTNHFEAASVAVWAAVALLAADVVVELVRRPRR